MGVYPPSATSLAATNEFLYKLTLAKLLVITTFLTDGAYFLTAFRIPVVPAQAVSDYSERHIPTLARVLQMVVNKLQLEYLVDSSLIHSFFL